MRLSPELRQLSPSAKNVPVGEAARDAPELRGRRGNIVKDAVQGWICPGCHEWDFIEFIVQKVYLVVKPPAAGT